MKKDVFKIALLFLIVIGIPSIIITDSDKDYQAYVDNYPDLPKDENWEYVKDRIATHHIEINNKLFKGPIFFKLKNASKEDSLVVNNLLDELKILLPSKEIGYLNTFIRSDLNTFSKESIIKGYKYKDLERHIIQLHFSNRNPKRKPFKFIGDTIVIPADGNFYVYGEIPGGTSIKLKNGNHISYSENGYFSSNTSDLTGPEKPELYFSLYKKAPFNERKECIEYGVLRKLLKVYPRAGIPFKERIMGKNENPIFNEVQYKPENSKFTSLDRFLLQKVYSPIFLKEFKRYMYKTYPWNYASNFFNQQKTGVLALWTCIILTIVIFILGFGTFYKREFKWQYLNYFIPVLVTLLGILYVYKLYTYMTLPYNFEHWKQYISIHLIVIIAALCIALFLMLFDKYFAKNDKNFTLQLVLKMSFTYLIFMTPVIIVILAENNNNEAWLQLNPYLLLALILSLGRGVILYIEYFSASLIKEKDVELSRLKELNAQNELKSLHAHVNPHFLYNALNSIASLVYENPKKTEEMTISLSDLFKYSINRKGEKMSTIVNEVEMVENYLKIEKIRFEERLSFGIHVEEGLLEKEIPMYVLQPLIENAIKHGISKIDEDGKIELILKKEGDTLLIIVSDNGPGFPDGLLCGHGLQSVYDLLRLSYGELATMNWENIPEKRIAISISSNI